MVVELVEYNDISYRGNTGRTRKYKIKCRMCESENTKIGNNGKSIWIKDKDVRGYWTGFLCYKCSFEKEKICYRCGIRVDSSQIIKIYNGQGLWTGEYVCDVCSKKLKSKCRNKLLPRDCTIGKRFIAQHIVAKVRKLKTCFEETDNFNHYFDLCDPEYSRIKVRVSTLKFNKWSFNTDGMENCDTVFLICMDRSWKNVKRVYIIPGRDITISNIYIYDEPPIIKPIEYNKFRADDVVYNDAYHSMKLEDCPVLKSD